MGQVIGILGGSFDPIHNGHLQMAKAAMEELALDRMLVVPVGDPPHKTALAQKHHRLRMVELAVAQPIEIATLELDRADKTYTVDTLETLHVMNQNAQLIMIIGSDTLQEITTWKDTPRVFSLCRFAVINRGNIPFMKVPGADIIHLAASVPLVSSTDLRMRVGRGLSLYGLTPPAVEAYIGKNRLYSPPRQMAEAEILQQLQNDLSRERYEHVVCTRWMIVQLAKRWGFDESQAGITALLHDCAKEMPLEAMIAFMDAQGAPVDMQRKASTALLHAPASAERARSLFGMTDPEVLQAIWYHNTGHVEMSKLMKLLFVADFIEPKRRAFPALQRIRKLAMRNLHDAVREVYEAKLDYMQSRGFALHPDTEKALAAFGRVC